jgi:hypothetical protein
MIFTAAQSKPVLTAEGKPWCQNCYVCDKQINFLKQTAGVEYLHVGQYVRHKKCYPPAAK